MKLAKLVEDVFFPSNVGLVGALILIAYFANSPYLINNIIAFSVLATVYGLVLNVTKRKVNSETKKYTYAFLISMVAFLALSLFLPLTREFFLGTMSLVFLNLIAHFIRDYWKISGHTMAYTAVATMLSLVDVRFVITFALLPLVVWSRLTLKRHDYMQIIAAFILSLLIPVIVFKMIG